MPRVAELSEPYGNFMLGPRRGRDVCEICFNLTDGWGCCHACSQVGRWLDVVAPISYSVASEQLHYALAGYKRMVGVPARRLALSLAAVLWRYLAEHERCIAQAAGADAFALVTTVPSSRRDPPPGSAPASSSGAGQERQTLHRLVAELVGPVKGRCELLLARSAVEVDRHRFDPAKYEPLRQLAGEPVLLIDDTWTTGANAQSAAAALKAAGAGPVAAVVIGRHVNRDWRRNDRLLQRLGQPFDWGRCVLCGPEGDEEPDRCRGHA